MSSTAHAPAHALPDTTHVASVRVGVRDLERSLAWYDRWFGLAAHALDEHGRPRARPRRRPTSSSSWSNGRGVQNRSADATPACTTSPCASPSGSTSRAGSPTPPSSSCRWSVRRTTSSARPSTSPTPTATGSRSTGTARAASGRVRSHLMTTASLDINDLFGELETLAISSGTRPGARRRPRWATSICRSPTSTAPIAFLRDVVGFELMVRLRPPGGVLRDRRVPPRRRRQHLGVARCPAGAGHDGPSGERHLRGSGSGRPSTVCARAPAARGHPCGDDPHGIVAHATHQEIASSSVSIRSLLIRNRIAAGSVKLPQQHRLRGRTARPPHGYAVVDLRRAPPTWVHSTSRENRSTGGPA